MVAQSPFGCSTFVDLKGRDDPYQICWWNSPPKNRHKCPAFPAFNFPFGKFFIFHLENNSMNFVSDNDRGEPMIRGGGVNRQLVTNEPVEFEK